MRAVDTNVLVRALVRDDAAQATKAEEVLARDEVFVPVTVMLELEWVLRSRYGFTAERVAQALVLLCALPRVCVGEADAVRQAAARVAKGWDFADALHHALSQGCEDFLSFDEQLVKRSARAVPKAQPPLKRP
ncbi:MAG: type II toxin-antitoxin system VapC family toxin [Betaproteobacteria bacterium]